MKIIKATTLALLAFFFLAVTSYSGAAETGSSASKVKLYPAQTPTPIPESKGTGSSEGEESLKPGSAAKSNPAPKDQKQQQKDNNLKQKVEAEINRSQKFKGITVEVSNNTILLSGKLPSAQQREELRAFVADRMKIDPKNINVTGVQVEQSSNLNSQNTNNSNAGTGNKNVGTAADTNNEEGDEAAGSTWDLLISILKGAALVVGVLLVIGLFAYAIKNFINNMRDMIDGHFSRVKKRQDDLSAKLESSVADIKKDFNKRIAELQDEVVALKRNVKSNHQEMLDGVRRSGSATSPALAGYQTQSAPKENIFPVSAEEFLNKRRRSALVVKPDFQNDILVQDPEENGELMLVQDFSVPGGLFYVVPKVGYFQTKADFYNYYEKYYKCHRPASGEVWIIEPAVVDKVSGGWELREQGELEVK